MILTRSRDYTINMGNNSFESVKIGATISVDTSEIPGELNITEMANGLLTEALTDEVSYFSDLTQKRDSFIHTIDADNKETK